MLKDGTRVLYVIVGVVNFSKMPQRNGHGGIFAVCRDTEQQDKLLDVVKSSTQPKLYFQDVWSSQCQLIT